MPSFLFIENGNSLICKMQQNLTICTASAGSGKTFSLIKVYLKILIKNPHNFSSILAITFTNKAASEMKDRLLNELEKLASNTDTPMRNELIDEYKHLPNPEETIKKNAGIALSRIIHNYSALSIMTIDSFFQLLVNAFAKELKIPIGSNIEVDMDFVLNYATKRLFDDLDKNQALTEWLFEYVKHQLETGLTWNLEINIHQIGKELVKEISTEYFKNLPAEEIIRLKELLLHEIHRIEYIIKTSAKECLQIFKTHGVNDSSFKRGIYSFYTRLAAKPKDYYKEDFATLKKWLLDGQIPVSKERLKRDKELAEKIESALRSGVEQRTREMIDLLEDKKMVYISFLEVAKNIFNLGIIHQLNEKIREFRTQENTLLISDTKTLLKGLITETDAPFILEKAGNQYQHILLDEFQDTSDIQWDILKPLIVNTLSQGGNIFIVGDAKQAIYKWRGGNIQLIVSEVKQALSMFKPQQSILETNYRSAPEIVHFNSTFFKHLSETLHFTDIYENIVQFPSNGNETGGYVEATIIQKEEGNEKPIEIAFKQVVEKISILINDGWQPKDIAIIVRKNHESKSLTKLLNNLGLKVISESTGTIAHYPAVKLIIQILRYIHQPNATYYTNALYLSNLIKQWKIPIGLVFSDHKNLHDVNNLLLDQYIPFIRKENLSQLAQIPVYKLIEDLIKALEFEVSQDTYLIQFLDIILQYATSKLTNVASFLQWWDEFQDNYSIKTSAATNAINILTIHKSKGLEFPIVFLPWIDWDVTPNNSTLLWVKTDYPPFHQLGNIPIEYSNNLKHSYFYEPYEQEKEETLLETLNLLYVAFTRARTQLYIFTKDGNVNAVGKYVVKTLEDNFPNNKISSNTFKIGTYLPPKSQQDIKNATSLLNISTNNTTYKKINLKNDYTSREIEMGDIIHETLALIHKMEDAESVIHQLILSGKIKMEDAEIIYDKVQAIFNIDTFRNWMQHAIIFNERDVFFNHKIYRPDRFFIYNDTIIIVDFKTGKINAAYNAQIIKYVNAFRNMNFTHIEGYLLYINDQPTLTKIA